MAFHPEEQERVSKHWGWRGGGTGVRETGEGGILWTVRVSPNPRLTAFWAPNP